MADVVPSPVLVGRDLERDHLLDLLSGPHPRGGVISGVAGVGKTALARDVVKELTRRGADPLWLAATPAARHLPFGVLSRVVGDDDHQSFHAGVARRAILARARESSSPLLVVVDDAHWLDAPSAAVLWQLLDEARIVLLTTVRIGEPVSDDVRSLWKDYDVEHLELTRLDDDAIGRLCMTQLGGDVDPLLSHAVARRANGLPLLAREMVVSGRNRGAIVQSPTGWRMEGDLDVPTVVRDAIALRAESLPTDLFEGLELVALGEPLPLSWLAESISDDVVDGLVAAGFIRVEAQPSMPPVVWLGHPLVGEAVLEVLAPARRRRLLKALASTIPQPFAAPADRMRYVQWSVEAGVDVDVDLLGEAAGDLVRSGDYRGARTIATAMYRRAPSVTAAHLLGHILTRSGEAPEAERVLATAQAMATTDPERAMLAVALAENQLVGLGDAEAAMDTCRAAQAEIADEGCRAEIRAVMAFLALNTGDGNTGLDLSLPELESGDDRRYVLAAMAASHALALDMRPVTALEVSNKALQLHMDLWNRGFIPHHPSIHMARMMLSLAYAGRVDEADQMAAQAFATLLDTSLPEGLPTVAILRSAIAFEYGKLSESHAWASRAMSYFTQEGSSARRFWCLGLFIRTAAQLGRLDLAREGAAEFAHPNVQRAYEPIALGGLGWLAWREGRAEEGLQHLEAGARLAVETSNRSLAVQCLFDLAVLGAADRAGPLAQELLVDVEGPLLRAKLDAVLAAVAADHAALERIGEELEALSSNLSAAEAYGLASVAARSEGDTRRADRLAARARPAEAKCGGAEAETLRVSWRLAPLTPREREVAQLAAAGEPSKVIASQLAITRRTVDNLLQRAYRKLGADGRADLVDLLGPPVPPVAPAPEGK